MNNAGYRATIAVAGRVQGVGFRYWTVAEVHALHLPITGTVRNLPDGTVEVVAESSERAPIEELIARLGVGPNLARIDSVHPVYETDVAPGYTDFAIAY